MDKKISNYRERLLKGLHISADDKSQLLESIKEHYHKFPETLNKHASIAQYLFEKGHRKEALEWYKKDEDLGRIDCHMSLRYAEAIALSGLQNRAKNMIQNVYNRWPAVTDGFARIGWIKAKDKDWKEAFDLAVIDEKLNRLSPGWSINLAILYGRHGNFDHAIRLIESAYSEAPHLKDGFARLGWIKTEAEDWSGAFELTVKDEKLNRLSPLWSINLGVLYGHHGDFHHAIRLIESAYAEAPQRKDGFARLGWIKTEAKDWNGAFDLAVRDEKLNRLSPGWSINLAVLYGRHGNFDHATRLIESAYAEASNLKDGFARLGWIKTETKDWNVAFDLAVKDEKLNRLSPGWSINLSVLYGRHGDFDHATRLIEFAYVEDPHLKDGFARLGRVKIDNKDWKGALHFALRDETLEKLSDPLKTTFRQYIGYITYLGVTDDISSCINTHKHLTSDKNSLEFWIKKMHCIKPDCDDSPCVMFDVGANNGEISIALAENNPALNVYAFEPCMNTYAILVEKTKLLKNYYVLQAAVSDFSGKSIFYISGADSEALSYGCSSLLKFSENSKNEWPGRTDIQITDTAEVRVLKLKDFIIEKDIKKIDLLHIDAQGADLNVLKGMEEKINIVKVGVMEASSGKQKDILYKNQNALKESIDFLEDNGFSIICVDENDFFSNENNIYFINKNEMKKGGIQHRW